MLNLPKVQSDDAGALRADGATECYRAFHEAAERPVVPRPLHATSQAAFVPSTCESCLHVIHSPATPRGAHPALLAIFSH